MYVAGMLVVAALCVGAAVFAWNADMVDTGGYIKPMVYRRTILILGPLFTVLLLGGAIHTLTMSRRAGTPPVSLMDSMTRQLLTVRSLAVVLPVEPAYPTIPASRIAADWRGDYQISLNSSAQSRDTSITERVINSVVYYRASKGTIEHFLTSGPDALSTTVAHDLAGRYQDVWFSTRQRASPAMNPPVDPTSVSGFFSVLRLGSIHDYVQQAVTTDARGATVIPLASGLRTWYIPASGSFRPTSVIAQWPSTNLEPVSEPQPTPVQFTYGTGALSAPSAVTSVPQVFAASWNQSVPAPRMDHLTPMGLLYMVLVDGGTPGSF